MKCTLPFVVLSAWLSLCWGACDVEWVAITQIDVLPDNAVLAAPEDNSAGLFYVARANINGLLTPGRFTFLEGQFFYTMDGVEISLHENFEVLTNPNGCYLGFIAAYGGTIPKGALVAGTDASGGNAYIARYHEPFGYMVGKFYQSTNEMYYGWGGGENVRTSYELLINSDDPIDDTVTPACSNWQQFDQDSFVCICSASAPCESIESPQRTASDVFSVWTTSFDGRRLTRTSDNLAPRDTEVPIEGGDDSQVYIRINRDTTYQEIIGFGGAFTDATGINLQAAGDQLSNQIINDYFSRDGIEYNMGRIPIGGSDFSTRPYTLDDNNLQEDPDLSHFALEPEDINYKIPYINRAQAVVTNELKVFGSPWSAPGWLKEGYYSDEFSVVGGHLRGENGSDWWHIYARYFIRYLEAYQQNNIVHWGITVQNEPLAGVPWNSMGYDAFSMRDFVATSLGPELAAAGWGTDRLQVMTLDHNVMLVPDWVNDYYADPVASQYTTGTAIHWYGHDPKDLLDAPHEQHPDKWYLATEACVEGGVKLGSWDSFDLYALDIIQDLQHYVRGWVDWNLVLDLNGGPNWRDNYVDAPILVDAANGQYYRQTMYYAMGHFSKFLPPGSVRLGTEVINTNNNHLEYVVFRTPDDATVIITYNREGIEIDFAVEDDLAGGKLIQTVAPRSLQTWIYYP